MGTSQTAMEPKPSESTPPKDVVPVISNERVPAGVAMRTDSPAFRCFLDAVPASMTTCRGPWAHVPTAARAG